MTILFISIWLYWY